MARALERTRPLVLVADDDDDLRSMLATYLAMRGFDVMEAEDGYELQDTLSETSGPRPDVVVTDVRMPGRNALDVLRTVGSSLTSLVIVMSGFVDVALTNEARALGTLQVLTKPVDAEKLSNFVASLFR